MGEIERHLMARPEVTADKTRKMHDSHCDIRASRRAGSYVAPRAQDLNSDVGDRSLMNDLGSSPTAVLEPVSSAELTSPHASSTHLTIPATVRSDKVIWLYVGTVVTIHLAALAAFIPWLFSWTGVALAILGVPFYGMGITLGYHRLLAHRSLTVPKWLEHGFALFAQCSLQDTPAKWVTVHRMHHAFSDEQPDPHSPLVNFFWSHFEWLVLSQHRDPHDRRDAEVRTRYPRRPLLHATGEILHRPRDLSGPLAHVPDRRRAIGWMTTGTDDGSPAVQPESVRLGRPGAHRAGLARDLVGQLAHPPLRLSQLRDEREQQEQLVRRSWWRWAKAGITTITTIPPRPRSGFVGGNSTSPTA